jgi:hypothetical protein
LELALAFDVLGAAACKVLLCLLERVTTPDDTGAFDFEVLFLRLAIVGI